MIISPAQAIELHAKYRDKFRTTPKGTIDENETESVSFTLADMTDLLKEMSDARPPATAVKVYFGAFDEVMKGTVITRKTVFFQPFYFCLKKINKARQG